MRVWTCKITATRDIVEDTGGPFMTMAEAEAWAAKRHAELAEQGLCDEIKIHITPEDKDETNNRPA